MKSIIYLLPLFFTCCTKFLEADLNKSQITTDKVFSNDVTATAALTGIYYSIGINSPLSGITSGMNSLAGLSSGELYNIAEELDFKAFEQHQINSQNPFIEKFWNFGFNVIYQANAVLKGIEGSTEISTTTARQLKGEALFIRAFSYFYLVNFFGGVPLANGIDYHINKVLPRKSVDEVYAQIEEDLLAAQSLLSETYITEQRVRPNKATATALLARMYLYRQNFEKAIIQASLIINDPAYHLTPKLNINQTFLINSEETIWQIMPSLPYYNTVEGNSFIILTTPRNHVLTDKLRLHFEPDDLRYQNWIGSFTNSIGTFYFPYKYKKYDKDPLTPYTECSIVFRLSELLLIRAEASAQLNDISGAQDDLSAIRLRAGLENTLATDKQSLLLAIESERWSELFTEYGHRWLDLKRTNRAVEILGNGITNNDLLYPLPAAEFIKNPFLGEQNPDY